MTWQVDTPAEEAAVYVQMAGQILSRIDDISASVYTQITGMYGGRGGGGEGAHATSPSSPDVERECDGFLNYDRTPKFSAADMAKVVAANQALIGNGTVPA